VITVRNLTKYYGPRLAIDDVGFDVAKGEIVGFLGPNGAGKTTTMRILTGYLIPSRGEVLIAGVDMIRDSINARRKIGYLPETPPLYMDMSVSTYLDFAGRLKGLDRRTSRRRVGEVIELCCLGEYRDVLVGKLSRGYRQRAGLAQALIHDPEVVILDEPTAGIDPIQVAQIKNIIMELGKNRTVLLSTHILPDVSAVCDRVIIIRSGRIIAEDRIENLSTVVKRDRQLRLRISGPNLQVTACLQALRSIRAVTYDEPFHLVEYSQDQEPHGEITKAVVAGGWTLLSMEPVEVSLEGIFLELTRGAEVAG
jgi:ABC-2 type transport system ATP-binding protein